MSPGSPWMFRYAAVLALCVFCLIVLGASITSTIQPVPATHFSLGVGGPTPTEALLEQAHFIAGLVVVSILTLGLAVWLQFAERRAWMRWLGWAALVIVAIEGWSGMQSVRPLPGALGFVHALLAPALLSMVVAIALGANVGRERGPLLEDPGQPSFRSLAVVVPSWLFFQVLLGAAFRHGLIGVIWHILNALLVTILVLVVSILAIRQFPSHPSLRPAALLLAIVTGVQVALGFATFIVLLIGPANPTPLLLLSVAHVATGAVTLAASIILAIEIRQNLCPPQR